MSLQELTAKELEEYFVGWEEYEAPTTWQMFWRGFIGSFIITMLVMSIFL